MQPEARFTDQAEVPSAAQRRGSSSSGGSSAGALQPSELEPALSPFGTARQQIASMPSQPLVCVYPLLTACQSAQCTNCIPS